MSEQKIEKLDLQSADLTARNISKIAELFPSVVTETRSEDGTVQQGIDFDALRQELSDHVVEGPQERYQLDWPGKRAAKLAANAPIAKTLRPDRDESVDFDTTKNLFIEGDNLDALKLLQESYLGKVKLIYIDPPYNTGRDFVYNDDFAENSQAYLERSGQVDADGNRLLANKETSGRFHSDWLSMMYPRLKLARNLLKDNGVIAVSINDKEAPRLRQILDEIFGRSNFMAQMIWLKGREGGNDNSGFGPHHEYVMIYGRDISEAGSAIALDAKDTSRHKSALPEKNRVRRTNPSGLIHRDGELFQLVNLSKQKDYKVTIPLDDGSSVTWDSYMPQSSIDQAIAEDRIFVGTKGVPYVKSFLADEAHGTKPGTIIESKWGTTKSGGIALRELFGVSKVFSYPKPPSLIKRIISMANPDHDDIILDLFAGSSSTASAVMEFNSERKQKTRFIMVQVNEGLDPASPGAKLGFSDIPELSRERIRRSAVALSKAISSPDGCDFGFRSLHVDSTNMRDTHITPEALGQLDLEAEADAVKADRTAEDLLFQVLLDWGLELSVPIEQKDLASGQVYDVDHGALLACFDTEVSLDTVRAMAEQRPARLVFRDSAFATDADRINAQQLVAELAPGADLKTI